MPPSALFAASAAGRITASFRMTRLIADILDACERNGLVRDDGRQAVLATIESGLAKSAGDALPDLGARHG